MMSTIDLPSGTVAIAPAKGLVDLRQRFGPITVADGKVTGPKGWESVNMTTVTDFPGVGHKLYVNRAIVNPLREALARCVGLGDGYAIRTIGCFAPRGKRSNPAALSLHSWGLAVDINADTNPMRRPMVKDIPDAWVREFESVGWTWGGRFATPDPMHFQWASGV